MKMIVVDNERIALDTLCRTIQRVLPQAEITKAGSAKDALKQAKENVPDIAFLDIEMPVTNGIELAKCLKETVSPRINIVFTTGYNEYIEEAFMKVRASGYLMKPITGDMIKEEIENLRFPIELKGEKRVRAHTFGTFELYIDDKPVNFKYKKTKELFAYLVDRGGICSIAELEENLWEETDEIKDHRSYLQNLVSDLRHTFDRQGAGNVIIRKYGSIGIDAKKIDCDLYEYQKGNPAAVKAFYGEYMMQYWWAENRLATMVFGKKK